ncbi:MAG: hypothetical protein EHM14_15445 [Methanothrix sp.]|nr:MAG: hypothetical protein EHM14_15445 [Methanothrix sp.]
MGEEAEALKSLIAALEIGELEGYLRSFLDEGEPIRQLLAASRPEIEQRGGVELLEYAEHILTSWEIRRDYELDPARTRTGVSHTGYSCEP